MDPMNSCSKILVKDSGHKECYDILELKPWYLKTNTVRPSDARFLGNEKTRAAQIHATFVIW